MPRTVTLTVENVMEVKELRRKNPRLTHDQIGKLAGVSRASAGKILAGEYDHLLEEARQTKTMPRHPNGQFAASAANTQLKDIELAVLELSEQVGRLVEIAKPLALAVAVLVDPRNTNGNAQVAEAARAAVRGGVLVNDARHQVAA